ncbi:N-acetylglucosamine kinase [Sulfuracidifex metallicus]|uniref:ATPase n=1 Tax=Sulfuracidifex metallicus DSM 6482 = JCM 9184 TaxID=523847 RepID=A0A6A9QS68_SULME|nr:BadF/BadG/BcrA/BcrD ATPase family protein [Sulfuracidifex metallicus]MUN27992.1 ATPase [Sulfuracidifex metallicus DSM 6482 = JCM 9184]WOE51460.1 BadF/BadG/BcrA/BcrD ATPase family protein [Sulfuracidifex metallicus DSM 6482 = JCM 9184]
MYLLIDAGGTSTKGFLYDGKKVVSTYRGPPGSVATVGFERSVKAIEQVVHFYKARFDGISIALAGTDVHDNLETARNLIYNRIGKFAPKVKIEHDAHVVLLSNAEEGCSMIAGTGSIIYCFDGKRRIIKGDRGWLVGDPCSGFWFGREYLKAVLEEFQGLKRISCMLKSSGFKEEDELVKFLYQNSCNQEKIASFSSKLFSCVTMDPDARSILQKGLRDIWRIIILATRTSNQNSLYYFGGLFNSDIFENSFLNFVFHMKERYKIDLNVKKSNDIINGLMRLLEF